MEEDDDHVVYGDAEEVPWISKGNLNQHPRKDTGRTYARLHEHLSKRREEESVNFANDQRDAADQQMSVQPLSAFHAMSSAALGQNVIANLESRFKDTADGADALDICTVAHAHLFLEEHDDAATVEAQNPLAALGLHPHASHMQQHSREDSVLLEGDRTPSGYQGVFARRNKRQSETASRHAMEQTGGYRSKRKTPLSKQKAKFAIREAPVMNGIANKTAIPDILKTLKGIDADARHASSGEMIVDEDEGCAYDKDAPEVQSPQAEQAQAAAIEAGVASPEQPQQHRRFGTTVVGGSTSLRTPVSAMHSLDVDMHDVAIGPCTTVGKSAQQNFLASLLQGAPLPRRQVQTSRGAASGTMVARLQQEESYMAHANGEDALQVEVLEMEREDNIIKCRCKRLGEEPGTVFAYLKSSMSVNTDVGCRMTICSPWKMMQLQSCTIPLYFVYHATNT